jgi:anti-anti-sigma factor
MKTAPFDVRTEVLEDGLHVFMVTGELDLNTAPELSEPLEQAIESHAPGLMVDLTNCDFIDSTGIAVLVGAWQTLEDRGAGDGSRVALCCPNAQVRRVLELTGVIDAIALHSERDAAIASLQS